MEAQALNTAEVALGELIGQGNFGKVYQAQWRGRVVAVKVLLLQGDKELDAMLKREAEILRTVGHHAFIVPVYAIGASGQEIWVVMELIKGGDLRELIKSTETVSWASRVQIAANVAAAMNYLHEKRIIYRDLKAKNVLVSRSGDTYVAKLCDFGFAREQLGDGAKSHMTLCGTDSHMAPEVILGMSYTAAVDVYSYGMVLLELITRRKIGIDMRRTAQTCFDIDEEAVRKLVPADCPPAFHELAFLCISYEPSKRPTFANVVLYLEKTRQLYFPSTGTSAAPAAAAAAVEAPRAAPSSASGGSSSASGASKPIQRAVPAQVRPPAPSASARYVVPAFNGAAAAAAAPAAAAAVSTAPAAAGGRYSAPAATRQTPAASHQVAGTRQVTPGIARHPPGAATATSTATTTTSPTAGAGGVIRKQPTAAQTAATLEARAASGAAASAYLRAGGSSPVSSSVGAGWASGAGAGSAANGHGHASGNGSGSGSGGVGGPARSPTAMHGSHTAGGATHNRSHSAPSSNSNAWTPPPVQSTAYSRSYAPIGAGGSAGAGAGGGAGVGGGGPGGTRIPFGTISRGDTQSLKAQFERR